MKLQANIQTDALLEASGIKKELYCQILSLARKYRVEKLILFGSRARGDWRAASDIDLAVSGGDFPRFALDIEEAADTLLYDEPYNNVILSGLVALYEICFEQAWKAMKEVMVSEGVREAETGSPKMIIKSAYEFGIITDEDAWLAALASHNNVARSYNQAIALDIVRETKERHVGLFLKLKKALEARMT